jgi:hypothetical protein
MVPQMKSFWETATSNEIISDLKEIFEPEVRLMGHECLNKFLSCKMDDGTVMNSARELVGV